MITVAAIPIVSIAKWQPAGTLVAVRQPDRWSSPSPSGRVIGPVVVDASVGEPWNRTGPRVVHDGFEIDPAEPSPTVEPACPVCGGTLPIALVKLLRSGSAAAWPEPDAVVTTFGLRSKRFGDSLVITDPIGLEASLLSLSCGSCTTEFVACLGYGEWQPARYLATYLGLVAIT